ncbi:hypothetical protein NVS47_09340 [Dehalobacterium formicoaceticum]|uniref:DUF6603 domain-containing protein n=1 Tax=Dehalobacterium formicoaceticum TaxID=51515 RepID=A0ABT1Y729_9FIRM|nr:DUF6603 domain-containing protein [Dehalobacterium formicoaceticum]MCR6545709.1 hypothetical protein [Dehalobacterium formicoaceticum]
MNNQPPSLQDRESGSPLSFALHTDVTIGDEEFKAAFINTEAGTLLKAAWINRGHEFSFQALADHFGLEIPFFLDWKLTLSSAELGYLLQRGGLTFKLTLADYKSLTLSSEKKEHARTYNLALDIGSFFSLRDLPIMGKMVPADGDGIGIDVFGVTYLEDGTLSFTMKGKLIINNSATLLPLKFDKKPTPKNQYLSGVESKSLIVKNPSSSAEKSAENTSEPEGDIHWLEVNKSFRMLHLSKLGFSLKDSHVTVYVDAGFAISLLSMEFFGLYLSIPLPHHGSFGFGLQGLAVTVYKPPFSIAGGLYKSPGETLYNGEISLKLSNFSLTALGSYGEMAGGEASFFLYVMLSYPLGGPPCFFVTGLAAGFGINRKVVLPELSQVSSFPFVAAATGRGGGLSPGTKPAQALDKLSTWLKPSVGDYFITAGVAFTSFGLFRSFALLTVEFGQQLQISLLGQSTVSMPPNMTPDKNPIAYAQLAFRAVFNPGEGFIEVIAALTSESYLLDKKCRLTGGIAFCAWFKGEYAGDFVVTLGGCHHPLFHNKHYPVLDKVGINWEISKNLTMKGAGYFAVTPACMMAGANLDITYSSGNLKAWLRAEMSLILQWKPFFYDLFIGVSLGASYTLKVWFVHKTFKLEIGASLHLWGPPFSGTVHINWYIISFTISFGGQASQPPALDWEEFDKTFLPQEQAVQRGLTASADRKLCHVQIADGIIRELKEQNIFLVSAERLSIRTHSDLPGTDLYFNGQSHDTYSGRLGVVPMNINNYTGTHKVSIQGVTGDIPDNKVFFAETVRENLSAALWNPSVPDLNADLLRDVPTGLAVKLHAPEPDHILPPKDSGQEAYDIDTLAQHEKVFSADFSWGRETRPQEAGQGGREPFAIMRQTMPLNKTRDAYLTSLAREFGTLGSTAIGALGERPEDYFLAAPALGTLGAQPNDITGCRRG